MSGCLPEVRVSGNVQIRTEDGSALSIVLGTQQAINVLTMSDSDLDFVEELLAMVTEYAKRARKRQQAQE